MTCRAPTNTVTCSGGTPTGAAMTYDAERRLATWQNTPSNPTSTAAYWYDGEGHRVAQTYNGTTTYYLGDDEEITGATLLKYYHIPGLPVLGTKVGDTGAYLASDGLGSETVDLSSSGSVLATALYGPYGVGRYATGTMPSSKGYTGQRQDSGSGLDYYNARYYDGAIGQFASADTLPDVNPIVFGGEPGMGQQLLAGASGQSRNRYEYVGCNPESATDPTGHVAHCFDPSNCDGSTSVEADPHSYDDLGQAADGLLVGNPDILYWPGTRKDTYAIGFRYSGDSLNSLVTNLQGQLSYLKGAGQDDENGKEILSGALSTLIGLPLDVLTGPLVGFGLGASVVTQMQKAYKARIDSLSAEITALQQVQNNGGDAIFVDVVVRGHTELQTLPFGLTGSGIPSFVNDGSFLPDGGNVFKYHPSVFFGTTLSASQAVSQVCTDAAIGDFSSPGIC